MQKNILAVDDSSSIRKLVEYSLKSKGYGVKTVADGLEAMEALAKDKYDAVVLDINMPRMNGFEVLKKIREDELYKTLPVVILTTEGQDEDRNTAMALGATQYVVKPFKPTEIVAIIDALDCKGDENG